MLDWKRFHKVYVKFINEVEMVKCDHFEFTKFSLLNCELLGNYVSWKDVD